MHKFLHLFCFITILSIALGIEAVVDTEGDEGMHVKGIIGIITDNNSRSGKEEIVAFKIALEDFYHHNNQRFGLRIRNSQRNPLEAASAAKDLIDKDQVQAIIGPKTWEETTLVAEICSQNMTPVLSLANAIPNWGTSKWPFLVQTKPNRLNQMKAIAAIVQSWDWYSVSIIYEDKDVLSSKVLSSLYRALSKAGIGVKNVVPIPPFVSFSLSEKLESLKNEQCRVFVVNLSLPLAINLFEIASKMGMMEKDYVWIIADPLTSLIHSLNASTLSTMQGIIGVKSYFPETGHKYEEFYSKFRQNFASEYPLEFNNEPGIFAALAYDAAWTVAKSMSKTKSKGGHVLLDKILLNKFTGLSGRIRFIDQRLEASDTFQIINVIGKGYKEIGFWSDKHGFSNSIDHNASYNSSMKALGQVLWPGRPLQTPRGWTLPTNDKPMRIGVPTLAPLKQFINLVQDPSENTTSFEGLTIDLFRSTVELLPYRLYYKFCAFNGSYDDLVKQISLKEFDAVIDVAIVSYRYQYAEFTQPYTDPGVMMVVPIKSKSGHRAWLFVKPFTKSLWILILVLIIYNGFALWILERNHYDEHLKGSMLKQTGTVAWLVLTSLLNINGDKPRNNLSRIAMLVWLFVALIITQTYTANLTSMLTVERLEPEVDNIDQLRNSNVMVGYTQGSFMKNYLQDVLRFYPTNMRQCVSLEEFAEAFRKKEIGAAFIEVPEAKIFLAKYCKEFIQAGPMYKIGGYGFAFPRGSPYLPSVNKALLDLFETGKLRELENKILASEECLDTKTHEETVSLSPSSFWALFSLTAGTSTLVLLFYTIRMTYSKNSDQKTMLWRLMMMIIQQWGCFKRIVSRKVSDVAECSVNSPNKHDNMVYITPV